MMTDKKSEKPDRSVQFITKLVQLTQDGELQWTSVPPPHDSPSFESAAFITTVDGRQLRTYQAKKDVKIEDSFGDILGKPPKLKRVTVALLEILDDFGQVTYTFDRTTGLSDLYESAAVSASGVNDLMDSILRR